MIEIMRSSVRPIVTILCTLATVYLIITQTPVPQEWWLWLGVITTFWFASRQGKTQ